MIRFLKLIATLAPRIIIIMTRTYFWNSFFFYFFYKRGTGLF